MADVDGRAVGSCTVTPMGFGRSAESNHVGLLGILIHHGRGARGIGQQLMSDVLERCRGRYETVRLAVFSNNAPAIRLYERLGFRRCGHFPREIRRGETYFDADEMILSLPPAA